MIHLKPAGVPLAEKNKASIASIKANKWFTEQNSQSISLRGELPFMVLLSHLSSSFSVSSQGLQGTHFLFMVKRTQGVNMQESSGGQGHTWWN